MSDSLVFIFPHADDEFRNAEELKEWLDGSFQKENNYVYYARKFGFRDKDFFEEFDKGSLVLFRKKEVVVGEGTADSDIIKLKPPLHDLTELKKSTVYYHKILFKPGTIHTYKNYIHMNDIKKWCKRDYIRGYMILGKKSDFEISFPDRLS